VPKPLALRRWPDQLYALIVLEGEATNVAEADQLVDVVDELGCGGFALVDEPRALARGERLVAEQRSQDGPVGWRTLQLHERADIALNDGQTRAPRAVYLITPPGVGDGSPSNGSA
jgi:hypothetical protein